MRRLVILRPEPGASASADRARAMGLEAVKLPLFEIRPLPWTAPDPSGFDAILMTSANAARHGGSELAKLRMLPVRAVGPATAAAAQEAGFTVISVGQSGIAGLALPGGERLLHLTGRDRLEVAGLDSIAVYESAESPAPDGVSALQGAVVAVHSPRAGRRLAELVGDRSQIVIAAISRAAADACGSGWERAEAAEMPNDAALLALAARLCNKSGQ